METNKVGDSVQKTVSSFLSDKPIWAHWIFYTALCAVLFGVFYAAMYFLAMQWWIPLIIVLAIGMIWGTVVYNKNNGELKVSTSYTPS